MSTAATPSSRPSRAVRLTVNAFSVVIGISLLLGLVAAAAGGSLSDLGEGVGGLYGVPSLLTTVIAVFVALPAAVAMGRRAQRAPGWLRHALVVAAGAWIVAIGYVQVAHSIDPCVNGWWDPRSRIGDQALCERFGTELNWHTRFHLLAHAGPAAALLAVYVWSLRHWAGRPIGRLPQP